MSNNNKWIENLPLDWEVKKLPWVCFFQEGPGLRNWQFCEDGIPVVCVSNISSRGLNFKKFKRYISTEEYLNLYKHFKVEKNDLLLSSSGSIGKICKYEGEFDFEFILNTSTIRLHSLDENIITTNFIKYIITSNSFQNQLNNLTTGSAQANFGPSHLKQTRIPIPSLQEQNLISSFLDKKTQSIDSLIAKIEKKIELFNEQKTVIINQYVTKGLNPTVEKKDSGIEWIGEIPKHWETKKLKYIINKLSSGVSVNAEDSPVDNESEFGVLKTSCVYSNVFNVEENKKVFSEEYDRVKCPIKGNSIIISRMNTPELIGASGYVERNYENIFLPDRLWITEFEDITNICVKWMSYIFRSTRFKKVLSNLATGTSSSMKNLTKDDLLSVKIPFCGVKEQTMISLELDDCIKKISLNINLHKRKLDLVKEYRQSLISSVVTGKIRITKDML